MVNPFEIETSAPEWDEVADEARERAALATVPAPLVTYSVTDAAIASLREQYAGLTCDTPQGYESTRLAIAHSRSLRGDVERRRVALKADALAYGRRVDGEAKRITALLLAVEAPLQANKDEVDNYKAQLKREKEEAEAAAIEFLILQKREAEEAALKAIRDAEAAEIATAREALAAEMAEIRAARQAEAAQLKADREALAADRQLVEAARHQVERAEFERSARIQAEADAVAKVERDRAEAVARQAEAAALLPDLEKARAWVAAVRAVALPVVSAGRIAAQLSVAKDDIEAILLEIDIKGLHEVAA